MYLYVPCGLVISDVAFPLTRKEFEICIEILNISRGIKYFVLIFFLLVLLNY